MTGLLAGNDETTPPAGARRLLESLPGPKKVIELPGGGHNDVALELNPGEWKNLWAFLTQG